MIRKFRIDGSVVSNEYETIDVQEANKTINAGTMGELDYSVKNAMDTGDVHKVEILVDDQPVQTFAKVLWMGCSHQYYRDYMGTSITLQIVAE